MNTTNDHSEDRELERIFSLARQLPRHTPSVRAILQTMAAIHRRPAPERRTEFGPVLDMQELAEFLRVDEAVVEQYLNEIPCFELGGKILFRRKSIEEWIERRENTFGLQRLESEVNRILSPQELLKGEKRW